MDAGDGASRCLARELAVPALRYMVIYRPAGDVVDMIAIFHTSRDPAIKRQP
jgi:hypothetical protein